jgi:hypothetical protein
MSAAERRSVRREIYADVRAPKATDRIDAFNRTYGLLRGLSAGFIAAAALTLVSAPTRWPVTLALALGAGLALYRIRRFSDYYTQELVVAYLRASERKGQPGTAVPTPIEPAATRPVGRRRTNSSAGGPQDS